MKCTTSTAWERASDDLPRPGGMGRGSTGRLEPRHHGEGVLMTPLADEIVWLLRTGGDASASLSVQVDEVKTDTNTTKIALASGLRVEDGPLASILG